MATQGNRSTDHCEQDNLAGLRERALAACRQANAALPADGHGVATPAAVRTVLVTFAEHGLLDFGFLDPAATTIKARDLRQAATVIETIASQSGALASIYMVNAVVAGACMALAGTPAQKADLLPRLRRGELRVGFALTEPEAGSDAANLTTTAVADGAGGFRLSGEKIYATGASTADVLLIVARINGLPGKRMFSIFLVPSGTPGLTVAPLDMLASGAHASCRVRMASVHVATEAVLGGVPRLGTAWEVLRLTGSYERLTVAAVALGLASAIVERALAFARQRRQFGQPIATFQAIQHALVEMKTTETAMRLFVENALATLEDGGDATQAICMAKYFCAEQLQWLAQTGMRILGGRAYFAFEDMARYYREAPFSLYAGGTVEIQKMLIARTLGLG